MWFFTQTEEKIIASGIQKIKSTYEAQRIYGEQILQKHPVLKKEDILSSDIPFSSDIPNKVKEKINSHSENAKQILLSIAKEIQDLRFIETDQKMKIADLDKKDEKRYLDLSNAFKQLYISYDVIRISINVMRQFNKEVVNQIQTAKGKKKTELMILNGVLVYELTNLVIGLIENFKIEGKDTIRSINNQISSDLDKLKKNDWELLKKAEKVNSSISESIKIQIAKRNEIRDIVNLKWSKIWDSVNDVERKGIETKSYLDDLVLIRDNSKNHIMALNAILTTQIVEFNMKKFDEICEITNIELAPLTKDDVCDLFGFDRR